MARFHSVANEASPLMINEVDPVIVAQPDHAARKDIRPEPLRDGEHADVLPHRQVDPNVRVHRGARRAMQDGGRHPDDQETDLLGVQGFKEFTNWM